MSKKNDDFIKYNNEHHIDDASEIYRPVDHLSNARDANAESRRDTINNAKEFPSHNVYQDNVHGREINKNGPTPLGKRPKASVISVVLLSAATSGAGIIGVTAALTSAIFDVSLFSKSETSLTFEINSSQVDGDDLVIAELYFENDLIASYDDINFEKYLLFGDLLPDTEYNLRILYAKDYYFQDSEGNYIYSDVEPEVKFSSNYYTSSTYYNSYITIEEYDKTQLMFRVVNDDERLPYVTTRVFFKDKEVLVKDQSIMEDHYEISPIPLKTNVYITLEYQGKGLDVISLEPFYEDIKISYLPNSNKATGVMSDDYSEANKYYTLHECAYSLTGCSFIGWSLTPDGDVKYTDGETILLGDEDLVLYAQWLTIEYSYIYFNGNGAESGTMDMITCYRNEAINLPTNTFFRSNYTFIGWSLTSGGSVAYEDGGVIVADFETIELFAVWEPNEFSISKYEDGCSVTYNSLTVAYIISNPAKISMIEIYFSGELVDPSDYPVDSSGLFSFTKQSLEPDTDYEITIISGENSLFNEILHTEYIYQVEQTTSEMITVTFSDSFMEYDANVEPCAFDIYDYDHDYFVFHRDIDAQVITVVGPIYEQTYVIDILNSDFDLLSRGIFDGHGDYKPEFSISSGTDSATFNSVTFNFTISDPSKSSNAKVYFDDVLLESGKYSVNSSGEFTVTQNNLPLESNHTIKVYDSHDVLIYEQSKKTVDVISVSMEESSIINVSVNTDFNDYVQTIYDVTYRYMIIDTNGVSIVENECGGEPNMQFTSIVIFDEEYEIRMTCYDHTEGVETTVLSKSITFEPGMTRPTFSLVGQSDMSVVVEYLSGDLPEFGYSYFNIRITKDTSYDCLVEYVSLQNIGDTATISLSDGGLNGEVGSGVYSPDAGTYTLEIIFNGYTFFIGTFDIT